MNIEKGFRNQFYSVKRKNLNFIIEKKNILNILKEKDNESFLTQDTSENLSFSIIPDYYAIKLPDAPKGLENFSLNCYMNSLLQCFYHIKGLRTSFIDPSKFDKKKQKVCYFLSEVMKELTYGKDKNYSVNNFKKIMGDINSLYKGHKGADVTDLYRTIIDSIINEYEISDDEYDNTNQLQCYTMAKKEVNEFNPIMKELNCFYETIYNCPKGYKCYSIENDTSIMFELLQISKWAKSIKLDLNICFEYNFREVDKDEFYCDKCKGSHKNKSQKKIISLPKVLTLILNRGKGKQFVNHIKFDEMINIEKYVDKSFIEKTKENYKYKLIGISTHTGSSSDGGHYYSYCYRENNKKYYCFNDTNVRPVEIEELHDSYAQPCILFYERIQ